MRGLCSQPDIDESSMICGHPLPCPRHHNHPPCPRCHRNDEHPQDWRTITLGARYDLTELDIPLTLYDEDLYLVRVCKRCRSDLLCRLNEWWRNPS